MLILKKRFLHPSCTQIQLERRLLRKRWGIIEAAFKDLVPQYY